MLKHMIKTNHVKLLQDLKGVQLLVQYGLIDYNKVESYFN